MDAFERGLDKLKSFDLTDVPRSLLHCDLMNRNVLVDEGRINAVFDWGCGRLGDHLYDLAWFEFWGPGTQISMFPFCEKLWKIDGFKLVTHQQIYKHDLALAICTLV